MLGATMRGTTAANSTASGFSKSGQQLRTEGLQRPSEFRFTGQQKSQPGSHEGQNHPTVMRGLLSEEIACGRRSQLRQTSSARLIARH